jgi:hypothetical protein
MSLATVPLAALQAEIARRQKLLPKLIAQRDALSREIAQLEGAMEKLGGETAAPKAPKAAAKRRRRKLPKNKINLADALAAFMKGREKVTVGEAMEGVLAAGYKSNASDFRGVVNNMLLADKRFKKVERGVFTLKG